MTDETLEREVRAIRTIAEALGWAARRTPPAVFLDAVAQDEFTHDVVVKAGESAFVVFDTTWLGVVTAVAVWDHAPDPHALLARRVAAGWTPEPTATRDGPVVLGHAACLAPKPA